MRSKRTKLLAITLLMFSTLFLNARAFEYIYQIEAPNKNFGSNEDIALSFIIKGNKIEVTPEAFKCDVKFDGNVLKYKKVNCGAEIKRREVKVEKSVNFLTVLYSPCKPQKISSQTGKVNIFEIVFTVKNKVCSGVTSVHADFKNFDSDALLCSIDSEINITGNPKIEGCKLKTLTTDCGNISPCFDPNVFNYNIEVPSETQNIDFTAVPTSKELSVKISRRKLAATGKNTNIKITVADKIPRIKSVYNIEVKRLPKNTEGKSKSNKKSKLESDTKTKKKHKKPKESSGYACTNIEENQEQPDELENENTKIQNNSDIAVFENSSVKTYFVATFCLIGAGIAVYFIIRFVKFRKKSHEKPNNSINNNLEK